jgi:ribosome biogenesis GTPase A
MAKAIRQIKESASKIDVIMEVLDARAPSSSRNPILEAILPEKPRLILLNKADLCDARTLTNWISHFKTKNTITLAVNAMANKAPDKIEAALKSLFIQNNATQKLIRVAVFGIPNVGKSTIINHLVKKKSTSVGDKPGVTKKQKWQLIGNKINLLDTPGILYPKFKDQETGRKLAAINCIKAEQFHSDDIAFYLCDLISKNYPGSINKKFKLEETYTDPLELFEAIGKKRGCFISGNEIDLERVYDLFLREFRSGNLGKISLEQAPCN